MGFPGDVQLRARALVSKADKLTCAADPHVILLREMKHVAPSIKGAHIRRVPKGVRGRQNMDDAHRLRSAAQGASHKLEILIGRWIGETNRHFQQRKRSAIDVNGLKRLTRPKKIPLGETGDRSITCVVTKSLGLHLAERANKVTVPTSGPSTDPLDIFVA